MKHEETSINHPARQPLNSERGQNPAAEADTSGSKGEQVRKDDGSEGGNPTPTPDEVMNEQVSPRDEQGNRDQSDKPHIGG